MALSAATPKIWLPSRSGQVVFEPVADFRNITRASRAAEIEAAVIRYAGLLEQYCRSDPYNWFNFFDFWSSAPRSVHPA